MGDKEQATELPLGLGMALACDPDVLRYFSNLTAPAQEHFIAGAHSIGSKKEMREYVDSLRDSDSGRMDTL